MLRIRTADAGVYTVTWQAATWVERRAGVTAATFKVGDRLVISGSPHRDPAVHELTSVSEVRRPRDGWSWRNQIPNVDAP